MTPASSATLQAKARAGRKDPHRRRYSPCCAGCGGTGSRVASQFDAAGICDSLLAGTLSRFALTLLSQQILPCRFPDFLAKGKVSIRNRIHIVPVPPALPFGFGAHRLRSLTRFFHIFSAQTVENIRHAAGNTLTAKFEQLRLVNLLSGHKV